MGDWAITTCTSTNYQVRAQGLGSNGAQKGPADVSPSAGPRFPIFSHGDDMSVSSSFRPVNVPALVDSMRRFIDEIEARGDVTEILNAEGMLWDVTLEAELRRHQRPPAKLPRVRRIEA